MDQDRTELDKVGEELAATMPGVSEHAVAAHEQDERRLESDAIRDSDNEVFDPQIHASKNGIPTYTATGKFRKRKASTRTSDRGKDEHSGQVELVQYRAAGAAAAETLRTFACTLGGQEFNYLEDKQSGFSEREHMTSAFTEYFKAKGIDDFPPGAALTIAVFGYISVRFSNKNVQTRSAKIYMWVKSKLPKRKARVDNV